MPMQEEAIEAPQIRVSPSAPLELMWLLHCCATTHPLKGGVSSLESLRLKFQSDLQALQQDGVCGATEIVVLAQRSGTLLDLDLDRFFASFDAAAQAGGEVPSLLSETGAERRAIRERLRRLQAEPRLRGRYRAILESVWKAARSGWETDGVEATATAAAEWSRLLDEGADFRTLLGRQHIWPGRPELDELADSAAEDGRLVLSPGWYFGEIHMIELDGMVFLGRGVRTEDQEAVRRETATRVAGRLKALADPTRLGILLWLAKHPASVTEIASHFELSQPTVSGHVQLLREAGLLEDRLAGRRSKLIVPRERLKGLIDDAESSMLRLFPQGAEFVQRSGSAPVRAASPSQ
jgi:DNA-binding transcriptional ArsR family regulator